MLSRPSLSPALFAGVLSLAAAGCYSYVPVQDGPVDAGQNVRLTVAGSEEEGPRVYTGRLQEVTGDTFVLRRPVARIPGQPASARDRRSVVRVPTDRVERVERESFSLWRSLGLVGGGGLAGYFALAELGGSSEGQASGGGDEDTGEFAVIPLLRIP